MPGPAKTAASNVTPDAVREAQDRFVAAWGQMAGAWGISRTMAEAHALLYITGEPMCSDDIMERLSISRGNASMSLRSLLDWGIVERAHRRGDRKEYFIAEKDVWAMFRVIVRERMKREVDPLLASLYEIRDMTGPENAGSELLKTHNQRLEEMLSFVRTLESLSTRFTGPSGRGLQAAAKALGTADAVADSVGKVVGKVLGKGSKHRNDEDPREEEQP
jgi:HTH-type transcriptional regulator, glycine betaine synthesis regulator